MTEDLIEGGRPHRRRGDRSPPSSIVGQESAFGHAPKRFPIRPASPISRSRRCQSAGRVAKSLSKTKSTPASSPAATSVGSPQCVYRATVRSASSGVRRTRRSHSRPLAPGRFTSRRIRSGRSPSACQAVSASRRTAASQPIRRARLRTINPISWESSTSRSKGCDMNAEGSGVRSQEQGVRTYGFRFGKKRRKTVAGGASCLLGLLIPDP